MIHHLKKEFPCLLRLSRIRLTKTSRWENEALHFLRGNPATDEVSAAMRSLLSELPSLMSMSPSPTQDFAALVEAWKQEEADSRVSTQHPTPSNAPSDDDNEGEPDVCPVCISVPPTQTTSCGHGFCDTCLDICARARPHEPLTCPLCRHHLRPALHTSAPAPPNPSGFAADHVQTYAYSPSTLFSGGRPRVDEGWLTAEELNIYLGYYVPVLNSQ